MRQIKEVFRLKHAAGCTHRQISAAVGMSKSSVSEYLGRAEQQGITWEMAQQMSDAELEGRLFSQPERNQPSPRAPIDMQWVHRELKRTGVTLQLLWLEYQEGVTALHDGTRAYQYSQFCELYRGFVKRLHPSMRQVVRRNRKPLCPWMRRARWHRSAPCCRRAGLNPAHHAVQDTPRRCRSWANAAVLDPVLAAQSSGQGGSIPSNPSQGGPRASCSGGSGSAPTTQPGIAWSVTS
jgi:hypothetical protein